MKTPLYACSANEGKLREFQLLSNGTNYAIEPFPGLRNLIAPEETGATFEENATLKALYYSGFTPELVFADDSGIEVDALGGRPGVHSARFAGPAATDQANNDLLLASLLGKSTRKARFVCVIALAHRGKRIETFNGAVAGTILENPSGTNGFGYDPLFFYPPCHLSFGEMSAAEKFQVSHRGEALGKLLGYLEAIPEHFVGARKLRSFR